MHPMVMSDCATLIASRIVLINLGVCSTLSVLDTMQIQRVRHRWNHQRRRNSQEWLWLTYDVEWLEQIVHMFEFLCLKGRVDPIDHVVVRLLLLLLYFRELLEMLFSKQSNVPFLEFSIKGLETAVIAFSFVI